MALKMIWMSPHTGGYGLRVLGGILGIALLAILLVLAGTVLSFGLDGPREIVLLLLCLGVTALTVALALVLRQKALRDATIFFLTEDDQLYAMDARRLSDHGHNLWGYVSGTAETQRLLRRLARMPYVPAGADQILKVENIRRNPAYYAVSCRVRHPNRKVIRRPYFIVKGVPEEESLLRELERREGLAWALEPAENRNPFFILASALVLAGFAALCVLSHPSVGRLPQAIYFPCLGAAWITCFFLVYFIVRQSRGQ